MYAVGHGPVSQHAAGGEEDSSYDSAGSSGFLSPCMVKPRIRSLWLSTRAFMRPLVTEIVRVRSTALVGSLAIRTSRPMPGLRHVPCQTFAPLATAEDKNITPFGVCHDALLRLRQCHAVSPSG